MKTLVLGILAGMAMTAGCGGVLVFTGLSWPQKIAIAVAVGVAITVVVWGLGLVGGAVGWARAGREAREDQSAPRPRPMASLRPRTGDSRPTPSMSEERAAPAPKRSRSSRPRSPEATEAMARSEQAVLAGEFREAADLLSDHLDGFPDDLDAHLARGRIFLDLSDFNRAMSDFIAAEEIDEASPEPQVAIGDLYFARKDYERAIEYFDAALELDADHPMALCRRGVSHYYRKNHADAVRDLERAQRLDPDIPNVRTHLAMARKSIDSKPRRR